MTMLQLVTRLDIFSKLKHMLLTTPNVEDSDKIRLTYIDLEWDSNDQEINHVCFASNDDEERQGLDQSISSFRVAFHI